MSDHDDIYNKIAGNEPPKYTVDLRKVTSLTLPTLSTSELKNIVDLSEIPGEIVKLDLIALDDFSVRKHLSDWKDLIDASESESTNQEIYPMEIIDSSVDFDSNVEEVEMAIKFDEHYSAILDASDDLDNDEEAQAFQEFLDGMDKAIEEDDEDLGQEEHSEVLDAINSVIFGNDEE